jgi:tRNA pseudouridine38-40 synthase
MRQYRYKLHKAPDFQLMNQAAAMLLQVEDFTSFSKLHTDVKTNICHVTRAEWTQVDEVTWVFNIQADRFLRNMVRAVVGTLLDVGYGKLSLSGFQQVIQQKDRCSAGMSVPAQGLFLADIQY